MKDFLIITIIMCTSILAFSGFTRVVSDGNGGWLRQGYGTMVTTNGEIVNVITRNDVLSDQEISETQAQIAPAIAEVEQKLQQEQNAQQLNNVLDATNAEPSSVLVSANGSDATPSTVDLGGTGT